MRIWLFVVVVTCCVGCNREPPPVVDAASPPVTPAFLIAPRPTMKFASSIASSPDAIPIPTIVATPMVKKRRVAPIGKYARWYACGEHEATKFLITDVTIPAVCNQLRNEIPLVVDDALDESGQINWLRSAMAFCSTSCGNQGCLYQSAIVEHHATDASQLVLNFRVSGSPQRLKESEAIKERVTVHVDLPQRFDLPNGAYVDVSWRNAAR